MMQITKTVSELRAAVNGKTGIAFVPTMGALHQGHVSLVKKARSTGQTVVVSVFVNPTQFNDQNDLAKYPRTETADAELLAAAGADILFMPSVEEVYPKGAPLAKGGKWEELAQVMEGARRPGHFGGVVQVVSRLLELVEPRWAMFGEKDFQQLAIIRSMVEERGLAVEIVGCPIVRGDDGLALSSRNALLGVPERAAAPLIFGELTALKSKIEKEHDQPIEKLVAQAIANLENNKYLCPEYIEVVDPVTLRATQDRHSFRICAAVKCGAVRLIDNI
ncbi:MAG: pantoate--beta-alanine ligase [Mucinivorans sp.]